ncbi:deoxyribose-phosphate aldolase [bacterium]|nr:deoxyribose-phosphate aldolase [bacterium]
MAGTEARPTFAELASRIDYAYLKVDSQSSVAGLHAAVEFVRERGLRGICVPPVLAGTVKKNYPDVTVCAAVSYPLGADSLGAKVFAVQELMEQRIDEVDLVLDLFALVNNNWGKIEAETSRLGELCQRAGVFLKVIIETPILNDEQIRSAVGILRSGPVDCVKTSTGYARSATSLAHVKLISDCCAERTAETSRGGALYIKAAGGINNLSDAQAMVEAGADIIGTSSPERILEERVG